MLRNRLARLCCAAAAVALVVTACGGGGDEKESSGTTTELASDDGPGVTTAPSTTEATTATTEQDPAFMPDLLGLTEDEARTELGDLGIDDGIRITERESLEEAGTVVEQVPSSGQRITDDVDLIVAKPVGPVPDFVGQQISDVEDWAEERGIEVRTEEVLDDTMSDGEVVATTPEADADATSEILVRVNRQPVVEDLALMEPTDQDQCYSRDGGEASVNGDSYANTLTMGVNGGIGDSCSVEYDFGRDWKRLKATLGVIDESSSDLRYRFAVYADGTELFNQEVGFGETTELDVDVSNALRVRLQISLISGDDGESAWGDLRRIGSPDAVDGDDSEGADGSTTTTEG